MALLVCTGCTARYSVGAAQCPQCGSTEYVEEGAAEMAKITVHGGASNAAEREGPGSGEPMTAVEGDEVVGDGSGRALPPIEGEAAAEEPEQAPRQRRARGK
jgi:RNA polymerase subunit RPABC4/transcription elongation factor Spt4